jgi:hypothetical protein
VGSCSDSSARGIDAPGDFVETGGSTAHSGPVPTRNSSAAKSLRISRRRGMPSRAMTDILRSLVGARPVVSFFKTQGSLALENLALRHQVGVLKRTVGNPRPKLGTADRGLCHPVMDVPWLGAGPGDRSANHRGRVAPGTGFKRLWTRKSRAGKPGRPMLDRAIRDLIRKMLRANPTWGSPQVRNELAEIGIELSRATVAKYMIRHRTAPSHTCRSFLDTSRTSVSIDFFTVPTATGALVLKNQTSQPVRFLASLVHPTRVAAASLPLLAAAAWGHDGGMARGACGTYARSLRRPRNTW